jgi:hypothetical protein
MQDVRDTLRQLATDAKRVHAQERAITLESLRLVGALDRLNAPVNLGMSDERFAAAIGLSKDQWWKRAQAARVVHRCPEAGTMLIAGETRVSHLAMAAAKITEKNSDVVLRGIKGATRREVEAFLSRVTPDGKTLPAEGVVELKVRLSESQFADFQRAREVLAAGGRVPRDAEVLMAAVKVLLDRRDPMRKAERSARHKRAAARQSARGEAVSKKRGPAKPVVGPVPTLSAARQSALGRPQRPAIPAVVRHAVWLRDGGRCTYAFESGERCGERMMLELDHIHPWCRGGVHSTENLALRCRRHNAARAVEILGVSVANRRNGDRGRESIQ